MLGIQREYVCKVIVIETCPNRCWTNLWLNSLSTYRLPWLPGLLTHLLNRLLSVVHRNYSGWVEFDTVNRPEKQHDGLLCFGEIYS